LNTDKRPFPVHQVRRYLEPGPVVLLSSRWNGRSNVMTQGWHMVLEFTPSLVGCMISAANHSFEMIRRSGECVINLPTADLVDTVVRIGNCTGAEIDKFAELGLTADKADKVAAPLIRECHAAFECRLHEAALVERYNFFVFEVIAAHVASSPEHPQTIHYLGEGRFMVAGDVIDRSALFRPGML
jgi:flavin reductase (DIM6/NTAB) family NADH-FMN oxidoreductase RutF